MYVTVFASGGRQLGLSCECFVTVEGSQLIVFLAYQLLTLPLWVDPLSPTHFSWLSLHFIIVIIDHFYIGLFSALKQTHCTHVTCDSAFFFFYLNF